MREPNRKSDNALLALYIKGDIEAQIELVNRYRIYSISLAKTIYESFRYSPAVEMEDLISIGLFSLQIAACHYVDINDNDRPLYPYWKRIAINEMMGYIKQFSSIKENGLMFISLGIENYERSYSFSKEDDEHLLEDVIEFLNKPESYVSSRDKAIFLDYISGMKIVDLSKKYKLCFSYIKRIIDKVRNKIITRLL